MATQHRGTAVARVVPHLGPLTVRVGDGTVDSHGDLASSAVATLYGDGSLRVRTEAAPPALWLQAGGVWLLPSGADVPHPRLRAQERLLLLSADALEAEPSGLVDLLSMAAAGALSMLPVDLLSLVLPTDGPGAAAVVWRSHAA